MKMIKIRNLSLKIGKKQILDNISFDVDGKTAIIGPNGSGKTTTLGCIAQTCRPDSGEMIYGSSGNMFHDESFKEKIGVMIQEAHFDPDKRVMQEMNLVKELKGDSTDLKALLAKYGIEDIHIKNLAHGKYTILLILQALLGNPELVVLDEPFSGLDVINRKVIENILKGYKGKMIITSHLLNEIKNICTDLVFIKDGKIIQKKKVSQIKDLDKHYIKLYG